MTCRLVHVISVVGPWCIAPALADPFACVPGSVAYGDYNGNGDVALIDHRALAGCLSGPGARVAPQAPLTREQCHSVFDTNGDDRIDLIDVGRFLRLFTGDCEGVGDCPAGSHLEHMSGERGLVGSDVADVVPQDATEYRCVPDESCDRITCHQRGICSIYSGKAVCACDAGYAGDDCDRCAVGYQLSREGDCVLGDQCRERFCSGQGDCIARNGEIACSCDTGTDGRHCENGGGDPTTLRPPTWIRLRGTDRSVELGQPREICATLFGGGLIDSQLTWRLPDGPGTLIVQGGNCCTYVPPPPGALTDSVIVQIEACSLDFPDQCATRYLTVDPPGSIVSTGQSNLLLKPFDDNIKRFMRYRCIGGAVLGISLFGEPVYVRGYGNLSGAPTSDPGYLAACGDTFDVSDAVVGYTLPNPSEVQPNTPFRIGSNSKAVSAAILRKAIKDEVTTTDTDANVEAVRLCDGIIPPELADVACLGVPPPVVPVTVSGNLPNCDANNPCPYGGTCEETNAQTGQGVCANCPTGFSGFDCAESDDFCPNLIGHADVRWEDVTLGHLMAHRSGLPRSGLGRNNVLLPNLLRLRDLMVEADWQDQEDALTAEAGFPSGDFNSEFPNFADAKEAIGESAYFVPRHTVTEGVLARMGTCLLSTPGAVRRYSNTGFALIGLIAEFVTGTPFGAATGKPDQHSGSLLESFAQGQLGLPIPGQGTTEGIYVSQQQFALRNHKEPVWRNWSGSGGGTYYALVDDEKRPYCRWLSDECTFSDWILGTLPFDWDFLDRKTIQGYEGASGAATGAAGSLAVEAEVYLRFMARYWVNNGDESDPRYGETRCPDGNCNWTLPTSHTGSLIGGYSDVKQLGGAASGDGTTCLQDSDCPTYDVCAGTPEAQTAQAFCLGGMCRQMNQFFTPPLDPVTGVITDDFTTAECQACRLPPGVDIFVAFNQRRDKKCAEAENLNSSDSSYYECGDAYAAIGGFLGDAACRVPWPDNPFVLWPPVTHEGGSSMSPQYSP